MNTQNKDNIYEVYDYIPSLSVYECISKTKNDKAEWFVIITLIQENKDNDDIFCIKPFRVFDNPDTAIQEGNGIIEMLGFSCNKAIGIDVYHYNRSDNSYDEPTKRWYNGKDFFKENPNKGKEK